MVPPNFKEWLRRLGGRGHMHEDEVRRRLESAVVELEEALSRDYYVLVVNDEFHKTTKIIEKIYKQIPNQNHAKSVTKELLEETKQFLGT